MLNNKEEHNHLTPVQVWNILEFSYVIYKIYYIIILYISWACTYGGGETLVAKIKEAKVKMSLLNSYAYVIRQFIQLVLQIVWCTLLLGQA